MDRILIPSFGPSDWRRFLADPSIQWRATKSAFELAVSWESARGTDRGLPRPVANLFDSHPAFAEAKLLIAIPEHRVALEGGRRASQTDLWALVDSNEGVISVAVEGKAGESFDKLVPEWLKDASPRSGKPARLEQLCRVLGITTGQADACRYQLLHRAAVGILEARRFRIKRALLLVQSFQNDPVSFNDYATFARLLGIIAQKGSLQAAGMRNEVELWMSWIDCEPADAEILRAAV